MNILKTAFPCSFLAKPSLTTLIVHVLVYLVVGTVLTYVLGLFTGIPLLGWVIGLVCSLADLYILAGCVLACLDYFKVLK